MRPLIQIVPFRSINPDGVGDYARLLAEALKKQHRYETIFLVVSPDAGTAKLEDGWRTIALPRRDAQSLIGAVADLKKEIGDCPIILHLSAYGFHNRGIPLWLSGALKSIKASSRDRLVTVFHELFATARPWKSAFWLGRVQAHIAAKVAALSDGGITTVGVYERWLRPRMKPGAAIVRAPVFSNMGEPLHVPSIAERPNRLVVFGTGSLASLVYGRFRAETQSAVSALGIEEVVDIGGRTQPPPSQIGRAMISANGRLEAADVSTKLLQSRYALLPYDTERLGKSTIYAALSAHGVIPICVGESLRGGDGLAPVSHFLTVASLEGGKGLDAQVQLVQSTLLSWYRQHGMTHCCNTLASLIDDVSAPESEFAKQC